MRLPTYSYSNVSSGCRFISSFGVERISSCVSGVTSRRGGNFLPTLAFTARFPLNFEFLFANTHSLVITQDNQQRTKVSRSTEGTLLLQLLDNLRRDLARRLQLCRRDRNR